MMPPVTSPPSPIVDPQRRNRQIRSVAPTTRSKVSLLTGSINLRASVAADGRRQARDGGRFPQAEKCAADRAATAADWLGEYAAVAIAVNAAKAPDRDLQLNRAPMRRKVKQPPLIMAVHAFGSPSATGTKALNCPAARRNTDPVRRDLHFINQQADGRQRLKALKYHWRHPE
jgi:hypothetical protein